VSFIHAPREISSFVPWTRWPYLPITQKEMTGTKGNAMTDNVEYRIPTAAELYALEVQARRARSREIAKLIRAGSNLAKRAFKAVFTRPYAARPAKRVSHA
jgi:hypothetical protein